MSSRSVSDIQTRAEAEKIKAEVYVNQDKSLSDLQTLIKHSFLLYFPRELLMNFLNHVTKFLSKNLLACLQDDTSSFRLFRVAKDGWQMMKYFSHRHKLHLLEVLPVL